MLIRFKAENWKSFPLLEFSAIAGREKLYRGRLAQIPSLKINLVPVSAIYGGNASGKSNFFKALAFARKYIVDGVKPLQAIDVKPFALDLESLKKPTLFEFEILVDDRAFRYSFEVTRSEVLSESLYELRRTVEQPFFKRQGEHIEFFGKLKRNKSLHIVGKGTQKNILFLTNSFHQKRGEFLSVYNWFQDSLVLISPNASCNTFEMYANARSQFQPQNQETLDGFDVGIERIDTKEVPQNQAPFQVDVKVREESDSLPEGAVLQIGPFLICNKDGKQSIQKMVAVHSVKNAPNSEVNFELSDESDGTCRLLDLIPAFTLLKDSRQSRVVFIDEIDRSLHHLLTRKLIEDYLDECSPESRSQLFFTTHDALLMDQKLLRRDELWIVDKNDDCSSLCSIGDFQIRYDKSLLKAYLYGRFGGVPSLKRR